MKYYLLSVDSVVGQSVVNERGDDISDLDDDFDLNELSSAERFKVYNIDDRVSTADADFLQGIGNPIVISNVAWEVMASCRLADNVSLPVAVVNGSDAVQRTDTRFVLFKESYEIANEVDVDAYHKQHISVFMAGRQRPPVVHAKLLPSFDLFQSFRLSCVCTERFRQLALENFLIGVNFKEVTVV